MVRSTALEDKGPVSGPEVGSAVVSPAGVTGGQRVAGIAGERRQGSGRRAAEPPGASERGRVAVFDRWEAGLCSVNVLSARLKGNSVNCSRLAQESAIHTYNESPDRKHIHIFSLTCRVLPLKNLYLVCMHTYYDHVSLAEDCVSPMWPFCQCC